LRFLRVQSALTQITIDAATTVAKLKDLREIAELRDEAGRIVGHYLPDPPRDASGQIFVPFSEEELEEFGKKRGGRPLKDILNDLSQRTCRTTTTY
jgi:hypothetical protein